jgi:hypothetical protein
MDAEDRAAMAERVAREKASRVEVENTTVLSYAREDAEGVWEDKLAVECQAWELSERERREQFEELTLLLS